MISTTRSTNFFMKSTEFTKKFLHSVIAVDDNMTFSEPLKEENYVLEEYEQVKKDISNPSQAGLAGIDASIGTPKASKEESSNHPFYYQVLAKSFAREGIVCSGLMVDKSDSEAIENIVLCAEKADITILDWDIDNDKGHFAVSVIKKMAESDLLIGGRLRLISIYTGEDNSTVLNELTTELKKEGLFTKIINNKLRIVNSNKTELAHWLITVISKDLSPEELPTYLIEDFTELTSGLLSNAAISCISEIRNKTHNILSKYNKDLDSAYVSHLLGLISLKDAREYAHENAHDYAVDLISEEIKAILQISEELKSTLNSDIVKEWPEYYQKTKENGEFKIQIQNDCYCITKEQLIGLISAITEEQLREQLTSIKIIVDEDNKKDQLENEILASIGEEHGEAIRLVLKESSAFDIKKDYIDIDDFTNSPLYLTISNEKDSNIVKLCALESTRRNLKNYGSNPTISLKMGSILKSKDKYFVCLQPLCDSVRLTEGSMASFVFLEGEPHGSDYNFVIEGKGNNCFHKILFKIKSKKLINIKFNVDNSHGVIQSKKENNAIIYNAELINSQKNDNHIKLEWIGELKFNVAQKIANEMASTLTRVGVDQHEWMRLKNKR